MPAAADPVMPRAAEPAPMRTAGGLFNGREVFRRRRERCGAALDLGVGAPHERAPHRERRGACERNRQSSHHRPPRNISPLADATRSPLKPATGARLLCKANSVTGAAVLATPQKCRWIMRWPPTSGLFASSAKTGCAPLRLPERTRPKPRFKELAALYRLGRRRVATCAPCRCGSKLARERRNSR